MIHQLLKDYETPAFHNANHKKHYTNLLNRLEQIEQIVYSIEDYDAIYQLSGLYAQRDVLIKSVTARPLLENTNSRGATTTSANPNANVLDRVETSIRHIQKELGLTWLSRHNRVDPSGTENPLDEMFGNV